MIARGARFVLAFAVVVVASVGCERAGPAGGEVLTVVEHGGSRPTVAIGAGGVVLVAWVDGGGDVRLARVESGEAVEVVRANDIDGDAAAHEQAPVQVATGPDGEVVVVWQNNREVPGRRFPASDLRLARSADGGRTFSPAVTVNDDAGGPPASHTFHDMVVAPTGTVHVSWIDGRAEAAGDTASGPQIRVASSRDGGLTFGSSVVVAERSCPCCRTSLALAPDGRLAVGWRTVREGIRDVAVSVSADGGRSWGEPVLVHADDWRIDGCPHAGPSLSWDAAGRLYVAWYTGAEGRQGLFLAVSDDAVATFGAPSALLSGEWVPPSLVSLSHDEGGDLWVAWDDRRADPQRVRLGRVDGAGGVSDVTEQVGRAPSVVVAGGVGALGHSDGGAVRLRVWRP
jgi:hypothetical protein